MNDQLCDRIHRIVNTLDLINKTNIVNYIEMDSIESDIISNIVTAVAHIRCKFDRTYEQIKNDEENEFIRKKISLTTTFKNIIFLKIKSYITYHDHISIDERQMYLHEIINIADIYFCIGETIDNDEFEYLNESFTDCVYTSKSYDSLIEFMSSASQCKQNREDVSQYIVEYINRKYESQSNVDIDTSFIDNDDRNDKINKMKKLINVSSIDINRNKPKSPRYHKQKNYKNYKSYKGKGKSRYRIQPKNEKYNKNACKIIAKNQKQPRKNDNWRIVA